jgi:hypothetical protein
MLEMNRYIVYSILAFIWIASFGTAVPTFSSRRYNVSFSYLCVHLFFSISILFFQTYEFKDYTQFLCPEGKFLCM